MLGAEAARVRVRHVGRKSRRRQEVVLTDESRAEGAKRIKKMTIDSRQKKTRDVYKSYVNSIHEWYYINRPELCNERGELIFEMVAENCLDHNQLFNEVDDFKQFLNARTHIRNFQDEAKTIPAKAGVGTLMGFRSAFNYYVWTRHSNSGGVPLEWLASLKSYFQGLKNRE